MIVKKNFLMLAGFLVVVLIMPLLMPFGKTSALDEQNFKASILVDYGTGQILSETNSTEHLPIASVTKLTTLLLTFEAIANNELQLDEVLIASENAAGMGGSQVFIDANSDYTVENLLHAIIISSANDASVMIAERLGGSEEGFVALMNERVKELGAQNTSYTNCTGLPSANAYSCANDVALVMREVVKYPLYFEISKIWMEDFQHPSGRTTEMANTNKLLRSYSNCDAGKTGSTNEAGYCMSATAKKGDMRLISVVLGAKDSKSRFAACTEMFNWGFANYDSVKLIDSTQMLENIPAVNKAKNDVIFKPQEDYFVLTKKGENSNISVNYEYNKLVAPIPVNAVVGKIVLTDNNKVIKEINIVAANNVESKSYKDTLHDIINNWGI